MAARPAISRAGFPLGWGCAELEEEQREATRTARAIGSLEATVKHLTETWKQQDEAATAGRRVLHEKIDGLTSAVSQLATRAEVDALKTAVIKLAGQFDGLNDRVTAIEPTAVEWKNDQQQKIGSNKVSDKVYAIVWGAMLAGATALGGVAGRLFDLFWPPRGH